MDEGEENRELEPTTTFSVPRANIFASFSPRNYSSLLFETAEDDLLVENFL